MEQKMTNWKEIVHGSRAAIEALDAAQLSSITLRREPNRNSFAAASVRKGEPEQYLSTSSLVADFTAACIRSCSYRVA